MGAGAEIVAVPQAVTTRMGRCRPAERLDSIEGEGFRPVYRRDRNSKWTEVPLHAADATALHVALRCVVEFSARSRESLRGIPAPPAAKWIDEDAADPPETWGASDTAAALRARGLAPFRFLTTEAEEAPDREQRVGALTTHFIPLLSAGQSARSWLEYLAAPGKTAETPRAWEEPPNLGDVSTSSAFVTMMGTFARRIFDRVTAWYKPPPNSRAWIAWRNAFDFAFGVVAIAGIPVRSIFEAYYGTGAIESVEPALERTLAVAEGLLSAPWVDRLAAIDSELPTTYRRLMLSTLLSRGQVGCDLYAEVFKAPTRRHFVEVVAGLSQGEFEVATNPPKKLLYTRSIELSTKVDFGTVNGEVYWGHAVAWERLMRVSDLVNQSGFALIVNAANNRWGGRHPPHTTHENGFDFDLDVAVPSVPGNVAAIVTGKKDKDFRLIANLSVEKKPMKDGPFVDEQGNRFALEPKPGRPGPVSQTLVDRLALWVALDALHLVEVSDVLYADWANMGLVVRHLFGQLRQMSPSTTVASEYKFLGKKGEPRQLLETLAHWNHLHAELPKDFQPDLSVPPKFTGKDSWPELYAALMDAAKKRDKDSKFLELMFGPPAPANSDSQEQAYRDFWTTRSQNMGPALLPVWDTDL